MFMHNPVPYNYYGTSRMITGENILPDKNLPFPCKGLHEAVSVTTIAAGTSHLVQFTGSVVHGGGSCQFAVTYEFPPPADPTRWKTIYTIIGGCPASAVGNLAEGLKDQWGRPDGLQCGNDYGVECVREFLIPFGKELPSGNATFAWIWLNRTGKRELYTTCAPVKIINGQGEVENDYFKSLPGIFLANAAPATCTTEPVLELVVNIPNPGKYGRVLEKPDPRAAGTCETVSEVPIFESSAGGSSQAGNPTPSAGVVVSSSGVGAAKTTETTSSMAQHAPTSTSRTTSNVAGHAPTSTPGPNTGSSSGSGPDECTDDSGGIVTEDTRGLACPVNGAITCFNASMFGLCANGIAIPQPVAASTTCIDGNIVALDSRFRRKRARRTKRGQDEKGNESSCWWW